MAKKSPKNQSRNQYFANYMAQRRSAGRDVGRHPHTELLKDKKKYRLNLELFLKKVFPEKYYNPFSRDQKQLIKEIQFKILSGGQEAVAMPRGEGKTAIITGAMMWSSLFGHKRYQIIVASDQRAAEKILTGIKMLMKSSNNLYKIFPEACHYVRALGGMSQRAAGQVADGIPTNIQWKTPQVMLPFVEMDAKYLENCAGVIIEARGLTGGIRGLQETLPDGSVVRPDFVLLDDPQTRESAASPTQCDDREELVDLDVGGLEGLDKELSCLMACTVIKQNDLADRKLSQWQSVRAKAIYELPKTHSTLWMQYIEIYREARKKGIERKECNAFYRAHRKEMDEGAVVANKYRRKPGEISALQNIYNSWAKHGEEYFWAELQNEPQAKGNKFYSVNSTLVLSRTNGFERNVIPPDCHYVNAGIDVNHYALNWAVSAMQNDMTGFGTDYGRYPKGRDLWTSDSDKTAELAIYDGIIELSDALLHRQPEIKLVGVDGNYATDTIYRVVDMLNRKYPNVRFMVFRGWSSDKYNLPDNKKSVVRKGYECHWEKKENNAGRREHVIFNSHYWHMWLQKAFLLNPGFPGSYSFWGDKSADHGTIADHIVADKLVELEYKNGKELMRWTKRPGERNDLADAVKISVVGASVFGAEVKGKEIEVAPKSEVIRNTSISFIQI